ncbi:YisL family protein [Halobacillus litoralis]|uniref:YisL family protein n=1 Tax=Halobacillus litoralis TaxID=45668 RepID=UPI001CD66162|nr:YisL family protein [Halobacillus litoralis]MCA0969626.1 YisL family protein [Halobacillus litoralis]
MAHLHITSWVLALVLVGLVTTFYRSEKKKAAKISHMILRVLYLVILFSGGWLFASYANYEVLLFIKVLAGIWVIASMELVSIKLKKSEPAGTWWLSLTVAAIVAIILGWGFLPLGILPA